MAILEYTAAGSTIRPPPKAWPWGPKAATPAAATRQTTAAPMNAWPARRANAPQMSRPRAEAARIASGPARRSEALKVMGPSPSSRGAIGGDQMLRRGLGDVEHQG